jgi:hypothetical protein
MRATSFMPRRLHVPFTGGWWAPEPVWALLRKERSTRSGSLNLIPRAIQPVAWPGLLYEIMYTVNRTVEDRLSKLGFTHTLSFPVAPNLEHRASVKRFVSLRFLNPKTVGRTPWIWDQPVARPQPIQTQNKHKHPCLWDSNP